VNHPWPLKRVGDILALEYGKPLDEADRTPDGLYPVYGANGQKGRTNRFYCDKPSIIVGRKGSAGELNLAEAKFWPLDVTYFVTFDEREHDLRFLYYLLVTLDLPRLAKGIKPGINRNEVYSQVASVPPLLEQRRIAAALDKMLAAAATARANTEQNLRSARDLLGAAAESLFLAMPGVGLRARPLEELCDLIVDCEHRTAPTVEQGIPSIRTSNIGRGRLLLDDVRRVSERTYREWTRRAEPTAGDLVLAREAPAGNVAVIPDGLRVCLGQRTVLIRPNRSIFEPAYLAYLLLKHESQQRLLGHSRGATVQHVNVRDIRAFKLSAIPPLDSQRAVVRRIDALQGNEDLLEATLRQKVAAIGALRESLVREAFTGGL
jgi:type I restriction enzyme S subunit